MGFKPRYKMIRPENVKLGDIICILWPCNLMTAWYRYTTRRPVVHIEVGRIEYLPNLRNPSERGVYQFYQKGSDVPFVQCIDWACRFIGYRYG